MLVRAEGDVVSAINRRSFLKTAGAAVAAVPFHALLARAEGLSQGGVRGLRPMGYGPLIDVLDDATGLPLLKLPEGFRYVTFGWGGDVMADGQRTPGKHDGMGAFDAGPGRVRLVRNHETDKGTPFSRVAYDPDACGGTTTIEFDTEAGRFISVRASLSGTLRNCAGGPTPWGSWLTGEETTASLRMPHGYVFEVPAGGFGDPAPIRDMGRFSHEAVAVDPATGYLYQTEDPGASVLSFFGASRHKSGFYRFVPNVTGRLAAGGQLFMLKVKNARKADLGRSYARGATFDIEWVAIAKPDDSDGRTSDDFVWSQGRQQGAATFARLEGCWYGNGKVFLVATDGGIGQGQVWEYDPAAETISLLFESPGKHVLNKPDHITVSPRGGIVLCEDGGGDEFLHGLTTNGELFRFAQNNVTLRGERNGIIGDFRSAEWAGPCYSPDGQWLFVNIYDPGITVAITGPWQSDGL
jgi:secreted PhoX family phosphatase